MPRSISLKRIAGVNALLLPKNEIIHDILQNESDIAASNSETGNVSYACGREVLPKEKPGALHLLRVPREGGQCVGLGRPL